MSQTAFIPLSQMEEQPKPQRRRTSEVGFQFSGMFAMLVLAISTIYFLVPFFWLIISSTKDATDLFGTFGLWFAPNFNLFTNLQQLFTYDGGIYLQWLGNSFLYAGVSAILGTFFAALAGYALSKYVFRGRNLIFSCILGAILVPTTALTLPLYLLMSQWNLTNTYWSVLLPSIVSGNGFPVPVCGSME